MVANCQAIEQPNRP